MSLKRNRKKKIIKKYWPLLVDSIFDNDTNYFSEDYTGQVVLKEQLSVCDNVNSSLRRLHNGITLDSIFNDIELTIEVTMLELIKKLNNN